MLYPVALLLALLLAAHGLRKGSLSQDGAITAFLAGYAHLANPIKLFGVLLIGFYLIGSRATKVKAREKAKYEDGLDPSKPGGNRNAVQVLSNCLPPLLAALAYRFHYAQQTDMRSTCLIAASQPIRPLLFLALAHFSTALADTLASELGILSTSSPFHILTFQSVPKGTNGGVSPLGLGVSILGGLTIGLIAVVDIWIENPVCRELGSGWIAEVVMFSMGAGLAGSLLDSILGATLQQTLLSKDGRILTDESRHRQRQRRHNSQANSLQGSVGSQSESDDVDVKQIGFGRDVLSNSGVNMLSTCIMAAVGWAWGSSS